MTAYETAQDCVFAARWHEAFALLYEQQGHTKLAESSAHHAKALRRLASMKARYE